MKKSNNLYTAVYNGCCQTGVDRWENYTVTKVFSVEEPLLCVLDWLRAIGVKEPNVTMVTFATLYEGKAEKSES